MKNTKKIFLTAGFALIFGAALSAQDFDDFGDFGDFGGGDSSFSSSSKLEAGGTISTDVRGYIGDLFWIENQEASDVDVDVLPKANVFLKYNGAKSDAELNLRVDEDIIKNHPFDVIDELVMRGYFFDNKLTAEVGKMKVVWGKGDKLHVIDNFNADDYTDFIIPDYIDRRLSIPMIRGVYNLGVSNLQIEGVYAPFLITDRFASSGRWLPAQVSSLTDAVTTTAGTYVATALGKWNSESAVGLLSNSSKLSSDSSVLYPDLKNLSYGQYGLRLTGTAGIVDFGASYYYGWYKQPSFNIEKMKSGVISYLTNGSLSEEEKFLSYDRKQTFGLEASTIIWHFNVRGEAAYNLTNDVDGTDPYVHNNSLSWLGGFDIDLPFWNANLNVQEYGTYILKNDEIENKRNDYLGKAELAKKAYALSGNSAYLTAAAQATAMASSDVDYNPNGYSNNKLAVNFTTSFLNDKLAPELTVVWGIEGGDFAAMPKIAYKPADGLTLTASGLILVTRDDDSEFAAWKKNSFVSVGAKYQF